MALDNIAVVVREGDTFEELQINIEKPWGSPYDYSNSVLVADIRRFFNDSTDPASAVDTFGLVEVNPTQGQLQLRLSSRQTEALGRNIPLGYQERGVSQSGLSNAVDPTDELQGVYLWDLREYFTTTQATITGISAGASFTAPGGVVSSKVRVTTLADHQLTTEDQILLTGTGQAAYDGVNFYANKLNIISPTVFEIEPTTAGTPAFSATSNQGTVSLYKEDTLAIGTLEVIPRISRDSTSS